MISGWSRPVVETATLPAHAGTTAQCAVSVDVYYLDTEFSTYTLNLFYQDGTSTSVMTSFQGTDNGSTVGLSGSTVLPDGTYELGYSLSRGGNTSSTASYGWRVSGCGCSQSGNTFAILAGAGPTSETRTITISGGTCEFPST